jgi:hypothetical protein
MVIDVGSEGTSQISPERIQAGLSSKDEATLERSIPASYHYILTFLINRRRLTRVEQSKSPPLESIPLIDVIMCSFFFADDVSLNLHSRTHINSHYHGKVKMPVDMPDDLLKDAITTATKEFQTCVDFETGGAAKPPS